ncbi:hypothetical protein LMG10661_03348 [Ralstonia syzygii subsp. syzygii]|nr:hypothetical protein LMG10661_03348 [Ralstonia syzygii subsp. syzygii]
MSEVIEFKSAFDAARFALCYSTQQYGESLMAKRLRGDVGGSGMGLVGLDGAGQAGMIRRVLWELPELHLAAVVARAAPRELDCGCGRTCCAKSRPNDEWAAAIEWLTGASTAYCSGFSQYRVRRAIIERCFGVKRNLEEIADDCGAHRNTVSKHNAAVRRWMDGDRRTGEIGMLDVAWGALDRRFVELGWIERRDAA